VLDSERCWQSFGGPGAGLCISLATQPPHQSLASKFHHLTNRTLLHVHGLRFDAVAIHFFAGGLSPVHVCVFVWVYVCLSLMLSVSEYDSVGLSVYV
jgi:hypothetical protein